MEVSVFILNISKDIIAQVEHGSLEKLNLGKFIPKQEWIPESEIGSTISLRTAEQVRSGELTLKQFNPSFFLDDGNKIHCRVPECSSTIARRKGQRQEELKEDLFLCETHRLELMKYVSKACEKAGLEEVKIEGYKHGDFIGYTSLIRVLENVIMRKMENSQICDRGMSETDILIVEVFLNIRNFLIAINALLNPVIENVITALGPTLGFLAIFLSHCNENPQFLPGLVNEFREMTTTILQFFGVRSLWVFMENPAERLGSGVGLTLGLIGSLAMGFPALGVVGICGAGLIAGNFVFGGAYGLYRDRQQMVSHQPSIITLRYVNVRGFRIGSLEIDFPNSGIRSSLLMAIKHE